MPAAIPRILASACSGVDVSGRQSSVDMVLLQSRNAMLIGTRPTTEMLHWQLMFNPKSLHVISRGRIVHVAK